MSVSISRRPKADFTRRILMSASTRSNLRSSVFSWLRQAVPSAPVTPSEKPPPPAHQVVEPVATAANTPAVVKPIAAITANTQAAAWLEMRRAAGWKPLDQAWQ
jgi:hypothetical protein